MEMCEDGWRWVEMQCWRLWRRNVGDSRYAVGKYAGDAAVKMESMGRRRLLDINDGVGNAERPMLLDIVISPVATMPCPASHEPRATSPSTSHGLQAASH